MTGIEPAYSAWEAISSAERLFESAWSGRRQRTQMPTAPAFSVRSTLAHGSAPVRLWFGSVRGTHGVPRANSTGRGNPDPHPRHWRPVPLAGSFCRGLSHTYCNRTGSDLNRCVAAMCWLGTHIPGKPFSDQAKRLAETAELPMAVHFWTLPARLQYGFLRSRGAPKRRDDAATRRAVHGVS